jgi:two-component system NtrC family sensor kinase
MNQTQIQVDSFEPSSPAVIVGSIIGENTAFGSNASDHTVSSTEIPPIPQPSHELAAESITVRIRWFGLCIGYVMVNWIGRETNQPELNAILTLGAVYALVDTFLSLRGRIFLSEWQLIVSLMEAVFIGLLCYFDTGLDSPFRFYYFLSLLVCAIRHTPRLTFLTLAVHSVSFILLAMSAMNSGSFGRDEVTQLVLTLVFMSWVTWAITALTGLMKTAGQRLAELNSQLRQNQLLLEERIAERTRELQQSQALLIQQEKQAAFGLLAAGIAHEVGNPLASISSLVQMLNRHDADDYTKERLQLVDDQLHRIQRTLRELVDFSRPATSEQSRCHVHEVINVALNIAKYYKRRKGKEIITLFADDLPQVRLVRDQLIQIILNLILNSMDATEEGNSITIRTRREQDQLQIAIIDTGHGITAENATSIFEPYFTTKPTGTGLGLFVCRQIVREQLNGDIQLTNSDTSGTTFTLSLPCVTSEVAAPAIEKATEVHSP